MFYRFTILDYVRMLWWGLWNPSPQPVKAEAKNHCPHCLRPY